MEKESKMSTETEYNVTTSTKDLTTKDMLEAEARRTHYRRTLSKLRILRRLIPMTFVTTVILKEKVREYNEQEKSK